MQQGDKSLSQIARDLELTESRVRIWVQRAQSASSGAGVPLGAVERQELGLLR